MYFGTGVSSQRLRVLPFPQLFLGLFLAAISVQNLGAIQAAPGKGTVAEPDNLRQADAAFRAGYTAFGRNDLPTALRDFDEVVKLAPGLEEGHSALGAVLVQLGQYRRAIVELKRSLALKPGDSSALTNLAMAYAQTAAYSKAVPLFQRLDHENGPDDKAMPLPQDVAMAYARSLDAVGRTTDAIAVLQRAVNQAPNVPLMHDELGSVYAQQKRWAEAKDEFKQAIALDTKNGMAHLHLGAALLASGRPQDSLPELALAAKLLPRSPEPQFELGNAFIAIGEDEKAISPLQRALVLGPSSVDTKFQLAVALQGADHEKEAIPLFREVIAAQPSNVTAIIDLALALVQIGNAKDAIALYRSAMRLDPKNTTVYQDIGVAYLQQSDLDDAIANFKSGLQLNPQDAQLHYDLGLAYKLKDNVTAAVTELQMSSSLNPDIPEPHYTLGILYMQEGRFTEAEQQLQTALHMRPDNADGWSILGSVYRQQNKLPEAVAALNEAIRQQPNQPSGYITLASILAQQGNRAAAAAERKKAAGLMRDAANRQRAMFATNSGNALREQGEIQQAVERYQDAIRSDPKYVEAYRGLAAAFDQEGKAAEATAARHSAEALQSPDH